MSIRHLLVPRTRHGAVLAAVQTGLASIAVPVVTGPPDKPDNIRPHAPSACEPGSGLVGVLATLPVVFGAITLAAALTPPGGAAPSWPDAEAPEDPDARPGTPQE